MDWNLYLQQYPDVYQAYVDGIQRGSAFFKQFATPQDFAAYHYQNNGQAEGRLNPDQIAAQKQQVTTDQQATASIQQYPDLLNAYNTAKTSNPQLSVQDFIVKWANQNPNDPRLSNPSFLSSLGIESNTTNLPLEQGLLQQAMPGLQADVGADAQRAALASQLGQQTLAGSTAATDILSQAIGNHFDGATYFQRYPDVAAAYQAQGGQAGTGMTVDQFAEQSYLNDGQKQGRQPAYTSSSLLASEDQNANRTAAAQIDAANSALSTNLTALQTATGQLQQNLSGDLAAKASALQTQLATLNSSLNQLDAQQKATLLQQIATQQTDLQTSIDAQRTALSNEISQLSAGATAQYNAQIANLQKEIAALATSNTATADAQRAALQTQLSQLQAAAQTQSDAQTASLQKELDALNAAQAPIAAARKAAAQLQVTAVNVGLQRTEDQLTAQQASQGYVGGSTVSDAALARAGVDARQQAAQAVSSADLANASDTRDIAVQGAKDARSIADQLASTQASNSVFGANTQAGISNTQALNQQAIDSQSATGERSIADQLAAAQNSINTQQAQANMGLDTNLSAGTQALKDAQAQGLATIENNTGLSQAQLQALGANQTYADTVSGADASKTIADQLAQGTYGLQSNNTSQINNAIDQAATAKANYSDKSYQDSLNAALALMSIPSNLTSTLTSLDNYGTSGLARTQNLLNWWQVPVTTAPTPGVVATTPSTTGNGISSIGGSLLGLAGNIGQSSNWWQTPTVTLPTTTVTSGQGVSGGQTLPSGWYPSS